MSDPQNVGASAPSFHSLQDAAPSGAAQRAEGAGDAIAASEMRIADESGAAPRMSAPPDRAGADAAAQAFDAAMASNSLCEEIGAAVSERMHGGSGAGSVSQLISSRCAALYPEQGGAEAGDADCAFLDQAQAASCAFEAGGAPS